MRGNDVTGLAFWVDFQAALADCLKDTVHSAVTVVVQEHRHPAGQA